MLRIVCDRFTLIEFIDLELGPHKISLELILGLFPPEPPVHKRLDQQPIVSLANEISKLRLGLGLRGGFEVDVDEEFMGEVDHE